MTGNIGRLACVQLGGLPQLTKQVIEKLTFRLGCHNLVLLCPCEMFEASWELVQQRPDASMQRARLALNGRWVVNVHCARHVNTRLHHQRLVYLLSCHTLALVATISFLFSW